MNVLIWHVHGAWTTAFVRGEHTYFIPLVEGRGPDGRGRARTYDWPANAVEITEERARDMHFDTVVYQRPEELGELGRRFLGDRRADRDLAALYVEHNAPVGDPNAMRHPLADRSDLTIVHVSHYNALFWDCGTTRARVIEHGIVDPRYRYSGVMPRTAVVINEAARRGRITGTDLLPRLSAAAPVDLFGIDAERLGGIGDLPQDRLHDEMALRRVYAHPFRWTSLGLALLEAMALGMPVVALATTDAPRAIPREAGLCSSDIDEIVEGIRYFMDRPSAARLAGECAREHALRHFSLDRFLARWDDALAMAPV